MKSLTRGSIVAFVGAAALLAAYASLSNPPPTLGARPTAAPASAPVPHSSRAPAASTTGPSEYGNCLDAAADCDFCRYATAPEAGDAVAAGFDQLGLTGDDGHARAVADFEGPAATVLTVLEPEATFAAPAPEISTAAMAGVAAVMLTARARRRVLAVWKMTLTNPPFA